MRRKAGVLCMVYGLLLLLGAGALYLYNARESQEAGTASAAVLEQVQAEIAQVQTIAAVQPTSSEDESAKAEEAEGETESADASETTLYETDAALEDLPVVEIDGYSYIGYISIPSLSLELPVMADWSYDQLSIAPCVYSGSVLTDDLVIAGHNYSQHFGPLTNIAVGSEVIFTDMNGRQYTYTVASTERLDPTDVEDMTAGDYPLTLFTCTYGAQYRVAVRCEAAE